MGFITLEQVDDRVLVRVPFCITFRNTVCKFGALQQDGRWRFAAHRLDLVRRHLREAYGRDDTCVEPLVTVQFHESTLVELKRGELNMRTVGAPPDNPLRRIAWRTNSFKLCLGYGVRRFKSGVVEVREVPMSVVSAGLLRPVEVHDLGGHLTVVDEVERRRGFEALERALADVARQHPRLRDTLPEYDKLEAALSARLGRFAADPFDGLPEEDADGPAEV